MALKKNVKLILHPVITRMVSNRLTWKLLSPVIRVGDWLKFERSKVIGNQTDKLLNEKFTDGIVRGGVFPGMKYPELMAAGSSLYPKLFGSYEIELLPVLEKLGTKQYGKILDIGCAEGYYAVGLAMKFPNAVIYAFDIDLKALELCKALAVQNNVQDKIRLKEKCDPTVLKDLGTGRSLILCDCEGYEETLFTEDTIGSLLEADLIIELHPFHVKNIRNKLEALFSKTHKVTFVTSYDNNRKIFDFKENPMELQGEELYRCIEEGRPFTMDWLIAESNH